MRQLGELVEIDEKTEEEMEKYEAILPAKDERVCLDRSADDGSR